MENIIEIKNLKKYFGEIKAVDDISFDVHKGSLFAFLGLNGAGKSTTINMICGVYEKDSGTIKINGKDLEEDEFGAKASLGVVYQNSVLDKVLTVYENLENRASLYGIYGKAFSKRLEELSALLDLDKILKRTYSKLSGGQRRRVDIARALIHKPEILILDEPTTGLDPQTRKMVWGVIDRLRKENKITVFLTTHYMEEAADADYVVILDQGKIVAEGTPIELKNQFTGDFITLYNTTEAKVKKLKKDYEVLPDGFRVEVKNTAEATELILKHPEVFEDFEITKGKMDDVFLSATGKKIQEEEG
ncbi:MAG: ABC transporter ATP-binding protein [Clostridia bacterium]|nr:ABC transporter ATP-binding protein [Clostridia bacterium]